MTNSYSSRLLYYIRSNWIQIILILLAIYDLRIDLRILFDFFTFAALFYTISEHPLAIIVLITIPNFFNSVNSK
mgnify:CR=1 FL=1